MSTHSKNAQWHFCLHDFRYLMFLVRLFLSQRPTHTSLFFAELVADVFTTRKPWHQNVNSQAECDRSTRIAVHLLDITHLGMILPDTPHPCYHWSSPKRQCENGGDIRNFFILWYSSLSVFYMSGHTYPSQNVESVYISVCSGLLHYCAKMDWSNVIWTIANSTFSSGGFEHVLFCDLCPSNSVKTERVLQTLCSSMDLLLTVNTTYLAFIVVVYLLFWYTTCLWILKVDPSPPALLWLLPCIQSPGSIFIYWLSYRPLAIGFHVVVGVQTSICFLPVRVDLTDPYDLLFAPSHMQP